MKAKNLIRVFNHAIKQIQAAIDSGEITSETGVSCSFTKDWEINLLVQGKPLKYYSQDKNITATKRWEAAMMAEIQEEKDRIKKIFEKSISELQKKITNDQEILGRLEKKINEKNEIEWVDPKRTYHKNNNPESISRRIEDNRAELNRLMELKSTPEGCFTEQDIRSIAAAEYMHGQILQYLKEASREDNISETLTYEWKTLPRLYKAIYDKAYKLRNGSNFAVVSDAEVYSWIHEYLLLDDKAKVDEERRKEAEEKERQRISSLKAKYDQLKRKIKIAKATIKTLLENSEGTQNDAVSKLEREIESLSIEVAKIKSELPQEVFAKSSTNSKKKKKSKEKTDSKVKQISFEDYTNSIDTSGEEVKEAENVKDESSGEQMSIFNLIENMAG